MPASDTPRKVFVHLLVHDPEGPIASTITKFRVVCTPDSKLPESASTVASRNVITCPLCLDTVEFLELEEEMDGGSKADRAVKKHNKTQPQAPAPTPAPEPTAEPTAEL